MINFAEEQERLTGLYRDVTECMPVLLGDGKFLRVSEMYAPLLIEEDLDAMKRTQRPDEPSGSKTLYSVRDVFYVRDRYGGEKEQTKNKLSTRILIKGEAGSGKSVFCLRLVEGWCRRKQSVERDHVCKLINQLVQESGLQFLLKKRLPEIPCAICELNQCLSQFDLLYYIPLRDATEGKTTVLDLIFDIVCKKRQSYVARTKRLLDNDNIRCLIVLDGVDEWPNPPGFNGLPKSDGLSDDCVLLWTMRPWKLVHLQLTPKHDDHIITVNGLSQYSVAEVIKTILTMFYGLNGEALESKYLEYYIKVTDKAIEGIMRMPMMLIAACHLWQREEASCSNKSSVSEQSFSKTHLYLSLLNIMLQNAARKQNKQENMEQNLTASLSSDRENNPPTCPDLPEILKTFHYVSHLINMLLPFCKLAFTDLMSAETKLVFKKDQLEGQLGKSHVDLAHRLGLISQTKVPIEIGSPQNVSVSFFHKSVQELLAAMYMTCGTQGAVTAFCKYCSSMEKVWETANVTMFVVGLDPLLGSRICEHITDIVNRDQRITEYRRALDGTCRDRVEQLYHTHCEWYREMTHNRTVTGDTSPPPSLHVTDIWLWKPDSDKLRLAGELMSTNLGTIASMTLWGVDHPLHWVVLQLPHCPNLSVLYIGDMNNDENLALLVSVIPHLTQLDTLLYYGVESDAAEHRAAVATVMTLTQLVRIGLKWVDLGDKGVEVTDAMTELRTVVLHGIYMTAKAWYVFISSLLTHPKSLCLELRNTDIDEGSVRRIQTSPHVHVTKDDKVRNDRFYRGLDFTTVPS